MKISLVHSFYRSDIPSGENNAVIDQARLLAEAGHEVNLIAQYSDEISSLGAVKSAFNVMFYTGENPLSEIQDFEPDLVHIHNLFPNFSYHWIEEMHIPLVATFHNFRSFCAAGTFMREGKDCYLCPEAGSVSALKNNCYRKSMIRTIPLAVSTSKSGSRNPLLMKQTLQRVVLSEYAKTIFEKYSPSTSPTHVIPNFAFRQEMSWKTRMIKPYWVYVGRLSEEKGIMPLLQNWPKEEILHVYGSGPLESAIKEEFSQLDNVFFKGLLQPEKRTEILSESSGLIFPSTCRENSPLIVGEAYSVNLPIVAFKANVVADLISSHGGGTVFNDFSKIREALFEISKNRRREANNAERIYEEIFSPAVWLDKITRVYELAANA